MITLSDPKLQNISPESLGELLIEAKKAYYTTSRPIMDDHTYDTLEEILKNKLPYHRLFSKVGTPNFDTGWEKKNHSHPMSSQNKVNNFKDLVHYFELKFKSSPFLQRGKLRRRSERGIWLRRCQVMNLGPKGTTKDIYKLI